MSLASFPKLHNIGMKFGGDWHDPMLYWGHKWDHVLGRKLTHKVLFVSCPLCISVLRQLVLVLFPLHCSPAQLQVHLLCYLEQLGITILSEHLCVCGMCAECSGCG